MGHFKKSDLNGGSYPHLRFIVDESRIPRFFFLLQRGFMIKARFGCSIKGFLCEQIGLSPDALERIQSIFLDGRPVDDLDSATIKDGSSLALSAAMPGLVGATLRRGGAYASFRSTITHRETGSQCVSGEGFVRMKLFNLPMNELGPDFLKTGIFVRSSDLTDFLAGQTGELMEGYRQVLLDGKPVGIGSSEERAWLSHHDLVFLSIAVPGRDPGTG